MITRVKAGSSGQISGKLSQTYQTVRQDLSAKYQK